MLFDEERITYLTAPTVWILCCEFSDGIIEIDGVYASAEKAQMDVPEPGTLTWSWLGTDFAYTEAFINSDNDEYRYTIGQYPVIGGIIPTYTIGNN